MAVSNARTPRLFVDAPLGPRGEVVLARDQAHYLVNVMRLKAGDPVIVFNGRDGEWDAAVAGAGRREASLAVGRLRRPQASPPDIRYCFAPLKRARLDFIAQKATELGAARLTPVLTRHTVPDRVNGERLRANAVEAAEQCGILWVPAVDEPQPLDRFLEGRDSARLLVFCDEAAPVANPVDALAATEEAPLERPDRSRRRLLRRGEGGTPARAEPSRPLARSPHHARGYGGNCRSRPDPVGSRRLAMTISAL